MKLVQRETNDRIAANRLKDEVALAGHLQHDLGMSRSAALRAAAAHVAENAHRYRMSGNEKVVSVTITRMPGDNGAPPLSD